MSLLSILRDKQAGKIATATPATIATQVRGERRTVASVTTVAVAKFSQGQTAPCPKVGTADTATASRWWLIYYPHHDPLKVACWPDATHAEILAWHPNAVTAEPFTPTIRRPLAPMTGSEETAIRAWLALIEETDPATIAEVVDQCQQDAHARDYFTGRAAENLQKNRADAADDDRRTCDQCANLIAKRCQAAKRGEIVASRNYEPIRDLPRRCEGYAPGVDDTDRRHGRERWPGLIQKGSE